MGLEGSSNVLLKANDNKVLGKMGDIGDTIDSAHKPAAKHFRGSSDSLNRKDPLKAKIDENNKYVGPYAKVPKNI